MKPIIFSGPMVRANLDGEKTQTRRVVRDQKGLDFIGGRADDLPSSSRDIGLQWLAPIDDDGRKEREQWVVCNAEYPEEGCLPIGNPYGVPSDLLWVRETWCDLRGGGFGVPFAYRADSLRSSYSGGGLMVEDLDSRLCREEYGYKWRPSIHMPRVASRITLRLTDVRVERVQEITWEDCEAEGCKMPMARMGFDPMGIQPELAFRPLWDSLNAKRGYGWEANPWVWVLSFERVK